MKVDHVADTPARRWCPTRSSRADVTNTLRLAAHVVVRLMAMPCAPLYADVLGCDGVTARIKPWGWCAPLAVPVEGVVAAACSTVSTFARLRAISDEQRGLEASWPS